MQWRIGWRQVPGYGLALAHVILVGPSHHPPQSNTNASAGSATVALPPRDCSLLASNFPRLRCLSVATTERVGSFAATRPSSGLRSANSHILSNRLRETTDVIEWVDRDYVPFAASSTWMCMPRGIGSLWAMAVKYSAQPNLVPRTRACNTIASAR